MCQTAANAQRFTRVSVVNRPIDEAVLKAWVTEAKEQPAAVEDWGAIHIPADPRDECGSLGRQIAANTRPE